jgi:branched-chain amino acid transport system ATP-binding protein
MISDDVLQVSGLCKRFGALLVTNQVDLAVKARSVHALIGPNGAGKSSLIGQITGTLSPDAGRVFLRGRDVTQLRAHKRARAGLARSFQISALVGGFSALENVALAVQGTGTHRLRLFGRASRDLALNNPARVALAMVGLASREAELACNLSHGEQRALELACALAMSPILLVLDEPLAGLGPDESAHIVALLASLKNRFAILLVEHDIGAVFALADQLSVLVAGQIIATGPPALIRADAKVRAAYLGDDPC